MTSIDTRREAEKTLGAADHKPSVETERPGVTVVVPAYNAARILPACLEALAGQRFPSDLYDVIVVDDGSEDDTAEIARRYGVQVIRQENRGPAAARNAGARLARRPTVLFTDADCAPGPDWIAEMMRSLEDPDVCAVRGAYERGPQRGLVPRFAQLDYEYRYHIQAKRHRTDMFDTSSAAIRRETFLEQKGFDESFTTANNEDTDLGYRLLAAGHRLAFNPKAAVVHQRHPASLWQYWKLKFRRGFWRMRVYQRHPGLWRRDVYTPWSLKIQCMLAVLLVPTVVLAALVPAAGLVAGGAVAGLFFLTALPFMAFAIRRDVVVGLVSPLMMVLRATALGHGALVGKLLGRRWHR